jgi:uncharacterized membrane protein
MFSKVKVMGHPLHPMLIAFPVAFYTACFVCFITYQSTGNVFWFRVGYVANVAGVVMAVVAAIPGFIDWAFGIPAENRAKKTGLIHLSLNVVSLVLFALCAWIMSGRFTDTTPDANIGVLLSGIGFVLTLGAGYYGWTLVQTHHVGVELTPSQEQLEPAESTTTKYFNKPSQQPV